MISRVLATIESANAKLRGVLAVVLAMEYCVQGGEAQMKVYVPGAMSRHDSQFSMSLVQVALHFLSISSESTLNPTFSRERSTEPVPVNKTSARGASAIPLNEPAIIAKTPQEIEDPIPSNMLLLFSLCGLVLLALRRMMRHDPRLFGVRPMPLQPRRGLANFSVVFFGRRA